MPWHVPLRLLHTGHLGDRAPTTIRCILELLELREDEEPGPPPGSFDMVCEPDADYGPWVDDVPEIEVG